MSTGGAMGAALHPRRCPTFGIHAHEGRGKNKKQQTKQLLLPVNSKYNVEIITQRIKLGCFVSQTLLGNSLVSSVQDYHIGQGWSNVLAGGATMDSEIRQSSTRWMVLVNHLIRRKNISWDM